MVKAMLFGVRDATVSFGATTRIVAGAPGFGDTGISRAAIAGCGNPPAIDGLQYNGGPLPALAVTKIRTNNKRSESMGLFDFWKDAGDNVIKQPEQAADDIKKHVDAADVKVDNLDVAYNDGVVEMSGTAASAEDMERAVIAAGNIKGVEEVKADNLSAPAPEAETEYYTIESGDTLSALAKKYYGDAMQYTKIFEANRGVISDPDKIYPGQKIRIPKA